MRILHLTTFLQGGAGLAIATLATAQARAGHAVTVMTSRTGRPGYGNYPAHLDALAAAGVRTIAVDSLFDRHPEAHAAVSRCLDQQLGGAAAFDLLHAHAAVPAALALAAVGRRPRRLPVLQTMHGWGVSKTPEQAAHDVAVLNRVDRVVVPARTSAALLETLGVDGRHVDIVPYGVAGTPAPGVADDDLHRLRTWRRDGDLIVCCVGTIGPRKNQALLVDALALLPAHTRVRVVFVGDGPTAPLLAHAHARGMAHRIDVLGYRPEARRYLAASHLLVLPSHSEGQPLAVLEAFCDGVPVLASRIPELAELVEHRQTGWLFDGGNAAALAASLLDVARAPGLAREMAARARAVYRERFTVDRMIDGYQRAYERAA